MLHMPKYKEKRPGQDSNLRSPEGETVFETVALPLDYLGILFKVKKFSGATLCFLVHRF
jgi:hypothetical protein